MGKHPKWHNCYFDVNVHNLGDDVKFKLYDDDIGKDDFIGEGSTKLAALVLKGGTNDWF
jgi:Ca2+-dependent lipid-binding protein